MTVVRDDSTEADVMTRARPKRAHTKPTTRPADARAARYRAAERCLWSYYGLEPTERFVELEEPRLRLRVTEVGSGPPVLFVPGTAGTSPYWGALVRELEGYRCVLVDRPGWGLSSPACYSGRPYGSTIAEILRGALDALGLDRVAVVGASIGDVWALRLAGRHPDRVGSVALLGGGPIVAEAGVPRIVRLIASPLGAVMVRIPPKPGRVRAMLRQAGHGASLDGERIPEQYIRWRLAFDRETDSMRNEREMVRAIVSWRRGFRSGLTLDPPELAAIEQPTLMLYGTADPVGSVEVWRRVVGLLPRGELDLVDGAGHVPWLDEAGQVGARLRGFLAA
jgi:2-hydroxy-6-oxonona-2,4-dienedioate hydrolase